MYRRRIVHGSCSRHSVSESQPFLSFSRVLQLVGQVVANIDVDQPFFEAGLDSLGAAELHTILLDAVGRSGQISGSLVLQHPTVRELTSALNTTHGNPPRGLKRPSQAPAMIQLPVVDRDALGERVVELSPGDLDCAIDFALHTPDGLCSLFRGLAAILSEAQPFFGIEHGVIRTGDPAFVRDLRLDELALEYGGLIVDVCNHRGCPLRCLVGASFGAALAHCILQGAHQLKQALSGHMVLIDPPPPGLRAFKTLNATRSRLEWRQAAATILLVRSSIVAAQPMNLAEVHTLFTSLQGDEIDLAFAHHLAELGVATASMRAVVDSKRRLDAWVHSQIAMLTSTWGCDTEASSVSTNVRAQILVLASERDSFFGEGPSVQELEAYFASASMIFSGDHLTIMARCAAGQEPTFNAAFSSLLSSMPRSAPAHLSHRR